MTTKRMGYAIQTAARVACSAFIVIVSPSAELKMVRHGLRTSSAFCGASPSISVLFPPNDDERIDICRRLAESVGGTLVQEGDRSRTSAGYMLLFDDRDRLGLAQPGSGFSPLVVDFLDGKMGHRARHQQGTEQVVKAASLPRSHPVNKFSHDEGGGNDSDTPLLWDLTAGLGSDAFLLALAGWRVHLFERSPVVAALVQDALHRARSCSDEKTRSAVSRMDLVVADSTRLIDSENERVDEEGARGEEEEHKLGDDRCQNRPAVVYLDPMFPQRKKRALVKKGMQMLQGLLGEIEGPGEGGRKGQGSQGDRELFEVAMRLATRKVVVKRPVNGAPLVDHFLPSHSVVSKNNRFDVYPIVL